MTKSQVTAASRRLWGKSCQIIESRHALSPAVKAKLRAERERLRAAKAMIVDYRVSMERWRALLNAAQFAADVNGDAPSIDRLREIVDELSAVENRRLERDAIEEELRLIARKGPDRCRYRVTEPYLIPGLGMGECVHLEADTLGELAERIAAEVAKRDAKRAAKRDA